MFRTMTCSVKKTDPVCEYFSKNCFGARCIRNNTNFIIRNVMTGLSKEEKLRTQNENDVLSRVEKVIPAFNALQLKSFEKRKARLAEKKVSDSESRNSETSVRKSEFRELTPPKPFQMPTADKWMLSYEFIDFLFKEEKDADYYSVTSQVNQQAIRKRLEDWKGYFSSLKSYKNDSSSFTGSPNLPGYIREEESTSTFTNQVCKKVVKDGKMYLKFTNYDELIPIGKDNLLPLVRTEVFPSKDGYKLNITFRDDSIPDEEPDVKESPTRFYGADVGVSNLLTVSNNFGRKPFIISGGMVKAENQWFNKAKAEAVSIMTKGHPGVNGASSYYTACLSDNREARLHDWFYRIGHFLFRRAEEDNVDAIIIGHNPMQKQDISIGHINNQNFVSIPFNQMIFILKILSMEYEIPVIVTEESYTSKASLIDKDFIPSYKKEDKTVYQFSGKRVKRGLYQSKEGIFINADINGASNIIRKAYPDAFNEVTDFSYLTDSVEKLTIQDILCKERKRKNPKAHKSYNRKSNASRIKGQAKRHAVILARIAASSASAVKTIATVA